jgi:hypothetical protein
MMITKRKGLVIACLVGLLLAVVPIHAAGPDWSAWLYDPNVGRMIMVGEGGLVLDDFILPTLMTYDQYSSNLAVSHGGTMMAYTVINSTTGQRQFLVYDRDLDALIAAYSPPPITADSLDFQADENIFNDADEAVAYSFLMEAGGWQIVNLDRITGDAFTYRYDDPAPAAMGLTSNLFVLPVIQQYRENTPTFTLVVIGTEGLPEYGAYTWDLDGSVITENVGYVTLGGDTFPLTGEVVMAMPDYRLPNAGGAFIFWQSHSLQVYDPVTQARYPFYNDPTLSFYGPHFIQNGERIVVNGNAADDTFYRLVVERSGTLVGYLSSTRASSTRGLADGFIYMVDPVNPGEGSTLFYVDTRSGISPASETLVWSSSVGTYPHIVWAIDGTVVSAGPFLPWAQLAPPVYASAPLTPTLPAPAAVLMPGSQATVYTTEGDPLNVRSGPSVTLNIVTRLQSGMRVTLLEGPYPAEGYLWWRLRAPDGIEGWSVQSADGIETLIP